MGAVTLSAVACTRAGVNPRADEAISREAFVQTYFELRVAGLRSPQIEISIEARDSILANRGLTEEDLLTFVDVWGSDPEVMRGIWEEVDSLEKAGRISREENPFIEGNEAGVGDIDPRGGGRP
jgi:hypothetical protein